MHLGRYGFCTVKGLDIFGMCKDMICDLEEKGRGSAGGTRRKENGGK